MSPYAILTRASAQVLRSPEAIPPEAMVLIGMAIAAAFGVMCLWFGVRCLLEERRGRRARKVG